MVFGEAEFSDLETKTFLVPERLDTGVYMALFPEVSVSIVCRKHHGYPIVSCAYRWLFIASAIFNFHIIQYLLSHLQRAGECLPHATKNRYDLIGEKGDATFHLRALRYHFRPRSIPSRSYNKDYISYFCFNIVLMSCNIFLGIYALIVSPTITYPSKVLNH